MSVLLSVRPWLPLSQGDAHPTLPRLKARGGRVVTPASNSGADPADGSCPLLPRRPIPDAPTSTPRPTATCARSVRPDWRNSPLSMLQFQSSTATPHAVQAFGRSNASAQSAAAAEDNCVSAVPGRVAMTSGRRRQDGAGIDQRDLSRTWQWRLRPHRARVLARAVRAQGFARWRGEVPSQAVAGDPPPSRPNARGRAGRHVPSGAHRCP